MCFECSKEPSHRDGSFEYPQHMFWLRIRKIIFIYALLSGGLGCVLAVPWVGLKSAIMTYPSGTHSRRENW